MLASVNAVETYIFEADSLNFYMFCKQKEENLRTDMVTLINSCIDGTINVSGTLLSPRAMKEVWRMKKKCLSKMVPT